jgi:uncharacterized protein
MRCKALIPTIAVFLGSGVPVIAQPADTPRTGVIDNAGVVDAATEQALNRYLEELEVKTKAQLKVLTVSTTQGRDFHDFGIDWAKRWRLGDAGEDNGVLVVIAVADRKWTIVTGEGIEDVLPDLKCKRIAEGESNFRRGDYSHGIHQGTVALARELAKSYSVQLSGAPPAPARQGRSASGSARRSSGAGPVCFAVFMIFAVILLLMSSAMHINRSRRRWGMGRGYSGLGNALFWGSVLSSMGRGGRSSGWSGGSGGGSFGGFGGGGFGGGGGGSFGGGGASGGW